MKHAYLIITHYEFELLRLLVKALDDDRNDIYTHFDKKVGKLPSITTDYHLYPKCFRSNQSISDFSRKALRFMFLRLQYAFGVSRHPHMVFKKGLNWASVSQEFVSYLLQKKNEIVRKYQHTFCTDEIFLQTVCWNFPFRERLFERDNQGSGCMRMIGWKGTQLVDWEDKDFDTLMNSVALFARKFNSKHINVVDRILNKIKSDV